jgi:tetratricopeptide (TPR) repeat protein
MIPYPRTLVVIMTLLPTLAAALSMSGCAAASGPYQPADPQRRDTANAESLTRQAADLIESDPAEAERLLRAALTADLFHGPAHNNLGVLYLNAGKLYEAAGEFEWARKLMPGHPDPRLNLGLALERGGRIDEALDAYRAALSLAPEHLPTAKAMARCQLRHARTDAQTPSLLATIELRGDAAWRVWAADQRMSRGDMGRE